MVIVMLVVHPLGSTYLASSLGTPNSTSLEYAAHIRSIVSLYKPSASGSASTVCGITKPAPSIET